MSGECSGRLPSLHTEICSPLDLARALPCTHRKPHWCCRHHRRHHNYHRHTLPHPSCSGNHHHLMLACGCKVLDGWHRPRERLHSCKHRRHRESHHPRERYPALELLRSRLLDGACVLWAGTRTQRMPLMHSSVRTSPESFEPPRRPAHVQLPIWMGTPASGQASALEQAYG